MQSQRAHYWTEDQKRIQAKVFLYWATGTNWSMGSMPILGYFELVLCITCKDYYLQNITYLVYKHENLF